MKANFGIAIPLILISGCSAMPFSPQYFDIEAPNGLSAAVGQSILFRSSSLSSISVLNDKTRKGLGTATVNLPNVIGTSPGGVFLALNSGARQANALVAFADSQMPTARLSVRTSEPISPKHYDSAVAKVVSNTAEWNQFWESNIFNPIPPTPSYPASNGDAILCLIQKQELGAESPIATHLSIDANGSLSLNVVYPSLRNYFSGNLVGKVMTTTVEFISVPNSAATANINIIQQP